MIFNSVQYFPYELPFGPLLPLSPTQTNIIFRVGQIPREVLVQPYLNPSPARNGDHLVVDKNMPMEFADRTKAD